MKPQGEDIGRNLYDIVPGSDFLDMTPKAPAPKLKQKEKDKLDYIKMSNFCTLQDEILTE